MNGIFTIGLIIVAGTVIILAERQQETNFLAMMLQNKGVDMPAKEIRKKLTGDHFYKISNICLFLGLLVLGFILWRVTVSNLEVGLISLILMMALVVAAISTRVLALFRIINGSGASLPEAPAPE